ncbi:MAG TPA: hypothetical protein VK002_01475 [Rubricoccaceae bacterium]|nr:hypothetical protein [Rubricoccaceae bacterium]
MRPGPPRPARLVALALLGLAGLARPAAAQPEVRVGGLAYLDYYYQLASPDSARDGLHGFTFRRLYLTTDARLSDAFSARARLEAADVGLGDRGAVPFVKDLYLRWQSPGGHRLTLGITSPPAYDLTEDVWGYRSLEKTLMDLNGVIASRDFGLRAEGPIPVGREGLLRYAVMAANGEGVFPEDDRHKRGYARLQVRPAEPVVLAVGASLATFPDDRDTEHVLFALAAYVTDTWRVGVEGYLRGVGFEGAEEGLGGAAVSAFGVVEVADGVEAVARFDRTRQDAFADAPGEVVAGHHSFALLGLSYAPAEPVRLIPNLRWARADGADEADLQARFTAEFTF